MKISAKARYGLRILTDIALHADDQHPRLMKDICEAEALSEKFTSRLVIPLREAGMISSTRGKAGGFRLARQPKKISLLEIIETLQGPVELVDCLSQISTCERSTACAARKVWSRVNDSIRQTLKSVTLDSLICSHEHSSAS